MSYVNFKGVSSQRVREIFRSIAEKYPPLQSHAVRLECKVIPKTTMRARPILASFIRGKKKFAVQYNHATQLDTHVEVEKLPDKVLKGWFAHELGHVMDYRNRSIVGMLYFGLAYLMSRRYRKQVEHKADEYAIAYGMADYILATKRYILEHSDLPESYKRRFRKYYMSEKNVHKLIEKLEDFQPDDAAIL